MDEYQLFVVPAVVGGGTRALPDQVRLNLPLAQEHKSAAAPSTSVTARSRTPLNNLQALAGAFAGIVFDHLG